MCDRQMCRHYQISPSRQALHVVLRPRVKCGAQHVVSRVPITFKHLVKSVDHALVVRCGQVVQVVHGEALPNEVLHLLVREELGAAGGRGLDAHLLLWQRRRGLAAGRGEVAPQSGKPSRHL